MKTEENKTGFTQEELNKFAVAKLNEDIEKLDAEFKATEERAEEPSGTGREVREKVALNMRARYEYHQKRKELSDLRDRIEGPGEGVKSFLNNEPPVSKFDVDAGRVKPEVDIQEDRLKGKALF